MRQIFGALIRGCCKNLRDLDLSGNTFSSSKKKQHLDAMMVPVSWKQFFASAASLQSVKLADNRLPPDAIKYEHLQRAPVYT